MFFKRFWILVLGIISVGIVFLAFQGLQNPSAINFNLLKKKQVNFISGFEGPNGKVLVVKIDDTPFARPQSGIEEADLVYIEQVEGGLTRLAAVFSHSIPQEIGPVRSARITDIDLLSQYGYIAFAYSGAQSKLRPLIAAANLKDVGAEKLGSAYYVNDPARIQPYAMMMKAPLVMEKLHADGVPISTSRSMGWNFGKAPESGTAISSVRVTWPASSYTATWSDVEHRWLLSNNGIENISASGKQLGATTFVIQLVDITPSEFHDKVGGITPLSHVIGEGSGYILRDGKYFPAQWKRENSQNGTTWVGSDGKEIRFAPGQIWVALTNQRPSFVLDKSSRP